MRYRDLFHPLKVIRLWYENRTLKKSTRGHGREERVGGRIEQNPANEEQRESRGIAVAGLNPHAGDEGNFGREEIDVIGPAVEAARPQGFDCTGPYSPDTVYVRARAGEFDAVLTMYHDQGQIAMKLMGFFEGLVYFAGLPFPLTTPAHGTAYEISGQGKADIGANRAAVLLAGRMAGRTVGEALAVG